MRMSRIWSRRALRLAVTLLAERAVLRAWAGACSDPVEDKAIPCAKTRTPIAG